MQANLDESHSTSYRTLIEVEASCTAHTRMPLRPLPFYACSVATCIPQSTWLRVTRVSNVRQKLRARTEKVSVPVVGMCHHVVSEHVPVQSVRVSTSFWGPEKRCLLTEIM